MACRGEALRKPARYSNNSLVGVIRAQTKLRELLSHFQTRDTEPPCRFRLIASSSLDGLREKFRLQFSDHAPVGVLHFATFRASQQFGNIGRVALVLG